MALRVQVNVLVPLGRGAPATKRELAALLKRAARAALEAHEVGDAELSLTVLGDAEIANLNERYLERAGPTDVISFALNAPGEPPLGDIYIGWEQALRQAAALGVPPLEELARLAIHGTLHVLGFDHPEGEERVHSEMWQRQETILREEMGE